MQRQKYSIFARRIVRKTHLLSPNSLIIASLLFFVIVGRAAAEVKIVSEYQGQLPKPELILVYNFAVSPDEVELANGISPRIARFVKGSSRTEQEVAIGRLLADSLSKYLVAEIRELGFSAEWTKGTPPEGEKILEIEGQFLSIDEGNRTERVVIGLGAGRTEVKVNVQVSEGTPQGRRLIKEFLTDAKSGRKPGMGEFAGAGALAGYVAVSAVTSGGVSGLDEKFRANVEADTKRLAKEISKQLKQLFGKQGWISSKQ